MAAPSGKRKMADTPFPSSCKTNKDERGPSFIGVFDEHSYTKKRPIETQSGSPPRKKPFPSSCKTNKDERGPSFIGVFDEHSYTKKRPIETESPKAKSKKKEQAQLGLATKSKWTTEEDTVLMTKASQTSDHCSQFWRKCAAEMNSTFNTNRTSMSCRLRFKKMLATDSLWQASAPDLGHVPLMETTRSVECQTEPAIPVISIKRSDSKQSTTAPADSVDMSTPAATLHQRAYQILIKERDGEIKEALIEELLSALYNSNSLSSVADCIFSFCELKNLIWDRFLNEIAESSNCACERRSSVLYNKDYDNLSKFSWTPLVNELSTQHNLLCDVLIASTTAKKKSQVGKHFENLVHVFGFVYGCLMKTRWKELSLVQRIVSVIMKEQKVHQKVKDVFS